MSIKIVTDFFNKTASELDKTYFPDVKYYRDNKNTTDIHYALELFNNGCLTYTKLINRISKACNETKENIHKIVSKYIETFGDYNYKPKTKKVDGHTISENSPKFGDRMICVQKNNFNYKKIMTPTKQQIDLGIIDTKNWKVIVE